MDVAFWTSLGGVVYAYFGYPVVLVALGLLVRAREKDGFADDSLPSLSIIIPAHNEAEVIGAKLDNMLALPYGGEVEIIVVSDGSTDSTEKLFSLRITTIDWYTLGCPIGKGKPMPSTRALVALRAISWCSQMRPLSSTNRH